jgi:hypothetical protein
MSESVPPEILKAVPGTLGAVVALRWIVGTPLQRVTALLGGSAASYYGTAHLAALMGTDAGLTGFLIGLFGMAVAAKCFEVLHLIDPGRVLDKLLSRWGL